MSFFGKAFNINSREWPRVLISWFLTFFARIGFVVGWITLTAMFVAKFGIAFLPTLFIVNALFMIAGSFLYAHLIHRMKKELLMLLTILAASLFLFTATFFSQGHSLFYFSLLLVAESVFVSQLFILLSVFIEDLFSPLESERTFPIIESAETIGAIVAGYLITLFLPKLAVKQFIFLWIIALLILIPVLLYHQHSVIKFRPLIFRNGKSHPKTSQYERWKDSTEAIRKSPFLKGLFLIMLTQWIFFNMLEFQYTKSVEQHILQKQEETLVYNQNRIFHISLLTDPHGVAVQESLFPGLKREMLDEHAEKALTQTLGFLSVIFGGIALLTQLFFASRFIHWYGVVGSLLIHPVLLFLSFLGVFFKFGYLSNIVMRSTFEIGYVIHRNSYHSSFYALKPSLREQAHEFLDGFVKPLGVICGMTLLLLMHFILGGKWLTLGINIAMATVLVVMLIETFELRKKYTELPKSILFSDEEEREKWHAVEILSQPGHPHAIEILLRALETYRSFESLQIRILKALGKSGSLEGLSAILSAFRDHRPNVRLAAVEALVFFEDLGKTFQHQAFSRYRVLEALRQLFRNETSEEIRSAIMRVFSHWNDYDVVPFLLEVLREGTPEVKAQCIVVCSRFRDPGAADYLIEYLSSPHPLIQANAAAALWHFPMHREQAWKTLQAMIQEDHGQKLEMALSVLGNIPTKFSRRILHQYLVGHEKNILFCAALSLMQLNDAFAPRVLADLLFDVSEVQLRQFQGIFRQLSHDVQRSMANAFAMYFAEKIHSQATPSVLVRLKEIYEILGYAGYAYEIQQALESEAFHKTPTLVQ